MTADNAATAKSNPTTMPTTLDDSSSWSSLCTSDVRVVREDIGWTVVVVLSCLELVGSFPSDVLEVNVGVEVVFFCGVVIEFTTISVVGVCKLQTQQDVS